MNYLLDTNIVSDLYDPDSDAQSKIISKLKSLSNDDRVEISVLTLYELEYGYANAPEGQKDRLREIIKRISDDFKVIPLSGTNAQIYGELKMRLRMERGLSKENIKKHNIDLMLAGIAIDEECILITQDAIYNSIAKIQSALQCEDWVN